MKTGLKANLLTHGREIIMSKEYEGDHIQDNGENKTERSLREFKGRIHSTENKTVGHKKNRGDHKLTETERDYS